MHLAQRLVLSLGLALGLSLQAEARPSIRVQPGDWGEASTRDIEAVLNSVADVLLPYFPTHASARIVVSFSSAGPLVLAGKSADGAHRILLNVRDARWDQVAYQFSHELCHVVSNYDHREIGSTRRHQWFEEAVCEAVSLIALSRLATSWREAPRRPGWAEYAPAFRRYADRLMSAGHRHVPSGLSMAGWYRDNATPLESKPYLREKNELAAAALLELLEAAPANLAALQYLNVKTPAQASLAAYLASWHDCCPESHRPFVRRVISLFIEA